MLKFCVLVLGVNGVATSPVQCTAASERPQWPTFHFFNSIAIGPTGKVMEPLNDANAIFEYKGLFHIMMQAGGGNWTHGISNNLVNWFPIDDSLDRADSHDIPWDSHQGPCDGTVSFPDLGAPPFDGSAPVILYGPDCNQPVNRTLGARVGDAPRVEVALPVDPTDPTLRKWAKQMPGPVKFEGSPCSFPGRVWKSELGAQWNMVCALDGRSPWARFTSTDPHLMSWKLADETFTYSAETGLPQPIMGSPSGVQSGAYFEQIPNPKNGGPTHMINAGTAGPLWLGKYDSQKEIMLINNSVGLQYLDASDRFRWAAVGKASDGRLLMVAWILESGKKCDYGWRSGFGGCARSVASLVRELRYDHAADQLVSKPVVEYDRLHNATFVKDARIMLPASSVKSLPVPTSAGGALDVRVSFDLSDDTVGAHGFGVSVRAPPSGLTGGVTVMFNVSAPDASGNRVIKTSNGPANEVLPYMNDTDLPGGDYYSQHLPPATEPQVCQSLCLQDTDCMAWVFVIRGEPHGSGDCLFKNASHECPISSPSSSSQGLCVAGRGHESTDHDCKAPKALMPPVPLLAGETLDVRFLVDRPIVEVYLMNGRSSFTYAAADFNENHASVNVFSSPASPITASNVSVYGMGCGWADHSPFPDDIVFA